MLEKLAGEIEAFVPSSLDDVARLALKVDTALDPLCDEVLVLKHFPNWPQPKLDTIRDLAGRIGEVRQVQAMLDVKRLLLLPPRPFLLQGGGARRGACGRVACGLVATAAPHCHTFVSFLCMRHTFRSLLGVALDSSIDSFDLRHAVCHVS